MNIYALKGHKARVTEKTMEYGYEYDSDQVKRLCKIGEIYTVDFTDVGQSYTSVHLKEFPSTSFNSVNFEDVGKQPKEINELHPDWPRYNR